MNVGTHDLIGNFDFKIFDKFFTIQVK